MTEPGLGHRASGQVLLAQGARFVIQGAGILLLARLLTAADFGLIAMVLGVVGVAAVIGDAGLTLAAVQASSISDGQRNTLFWVNTGLGVALGIVVFAVAQPVASFYGRPELIDVTRLMALTFPLNGLAAQFRAHLNRQLRFRALIVADLLPQAFGLLAAVGLAWAGWGYWSLVWQQVVAALSTLLVLAVAARWLPGRPSDWRNSLALVRFGAGVLVVQVANFLSTSAPSIFLGRVAGPAEAGYFSRAYALFALPMTQIVAPLTRVALPLYARTESAVALGQALLRAQRLVATAMVGVFAVVAALAFPLVAVLLGPDWAPAAPVFQVLAVGGAFQALAYVYYLAFLATASTRLQVLYMLPLRAFTVALIAIGVIWGSVGAAIGLTIGLAVVWLVVSVGASNTMGLPTVELIRTAVGGIALWAIIGGVVWALDTFLWPAFPAVSRLAIGIGAAGAMLAIVALVVRPVRDAIVFCLQTVAAMAGRSGALPAK